MTGRGIAMSGDGAAVCNYAVQDYVDGLGPTRTLAQCAEPIAVGPQVFDLLRRTWCENREHVVSKDELFDAVWRGQDSRPNRP